jgi:linoleoyl-CoA desaturase
VAVPAAEYWKMILFKIFFLFYMIVFPKMILPVGWQHIGIAFLIFLFTASGFSLLVLLSPHANTANAFPLPDENNRLPHSWMMHMLLTTNDVTHDNFFTRFFMGCFNFHVAHHLFPNVNHVYYPEITQRLKELSARHGLPYREFSLFSSLLGHYRLLKKNSVRENIFEEAM